MSWEVKPLGELSKIMYGYTESSSIEEVGPRFLRITDIQENGVEWSSVPYCKIAADDLKKYRLNSGDIVFARTGATTGKSFLVADPPESVFASYLIRVQINKPSVLPEYLNLYFQTPQYWEKINAGTTGSAQGGFNATKLGELDIPIPPLPEQQRIVGKLDAAFAALAEAQAHVERNRANARELFESKAEQIFGAQNEEWPSKLLGELCRIRTGKKDVNQGNPSGVYPFFTCAAQHTYSDVFSFDAEALLVAGNGDVGHVTYYKGKFEAYQRTYVLTDFAGVSARYLYQALDGRLKRSVARKRLGNTMPYIKVGMLSEFVVPLPDLNEQSRIVEYLEQLKAEALQLETTYQLKLSELAGLKKAVLGAAFRGEL